MVCEDTISFYTIKVSRVHTTEKWERSYYLTNNGSVATDKLFASKELLLKSL